MYKILSIFSILIASADTLNLDTGDSFGTFFQRLFKADFMPHGHCYFWRGELVWLHVISDALIFLAYFSIPLMLLHFRKRRKDLPYPGMFALFAGFIFWCGTTHALNIVTLWFPIYRAEGVVKFITAMISVLTAILLFPLIPQALSLRSEKELETEKAKRREVENFAHIASHDLREPLRTISLFSDLLKQKLNTQGDPEMAEYFSHIMRNANRMANLIEDLASYSRVDPEGQLESILIEDSLVRALDNLTSMIKETGAEVSSTFTHREIKIQAIRTQITQLFQNLLVNAIKFRKPGHSPKIEVKGVIKNGSWIVSVRDNGIGFDEQFKDQIFLVFKRLHSSEEQYSGTGMGLAICKKVVEQHGGKIWAESALGEGSTFYFSLPIEKKA